MAGDQNYHATAFPCSNEQFTHGNPQTGDASSGMTKREYMATAILPAVIAATSSGQHHPNLDGMSLTAAMARDAVAMADALLLELSKP